VGREFECAACGWRIDRQSNAGLNLYVTARREYAELRGLWLDLDALPKDVVRPLYVRESDARAERMGREGRTAPVMGTE
jgi:transposase